MASGYEKAASGAKPGGRWNREGARPSLASRMVDAAMLIAGLALMALKVWLLLQL